MTGWGFGAKKVRPEISRPRPENRLGPMDDGMKGAEDGCFQEWPLTRSV